LRRDADRLGCCAPGEFGGLRGNPQLQLAAIVARGGAGGFDRRMDRRADGIGLRIVGAGKQLVGIAQRQRASGLDRAMRFVERLERRRAFDRGWSSEHRAHRLERLLGDPPAFGHCGEIAPGFDHADEAVQPLDRRRFES
jgi:hypothetical protein